MKCQGTVKFTVNPIAVPIPSAYWELEEAGGNRVDSVHGLNLAFEGVGSPLSIVQATGKIAKAVGIQNPAVFVNLIIHANAALRMGATGWTVTCWLKLNTPQAVSELSVTWEGGTGNDFFEVDINIDRTLANQSFLGVDIGDDGVGEYTNSTVAPLVTGVWYFVALVYSSTGLVTVYLNNVATLSLNPGLVMTGDTSGSFAIIGIGNGSAFDVTVDEVGLWLTKPLTAANISALYNSGVGARPPFS